MSDVNSGLRLERALIGTAQVDWVLPFPPELRGEVERRVREVPAAETNNLLIAHLLDVGTVRDVRAYAERTRRPVLLAEPGGVSFHTPKSWSPFPQEDAYEDVLLARRGQSIADVRRILTQVGIPFRDTASPRRAVRVRRTLAPRAYEIVRYASPLLTPKTFYCLTPASDRLVVEFAGKLCDNPTPESLFDFLAYYWAFVYFGGEKHPGGISDTVTREAVWIFGRAAALRMWMSEKIGARIADEVFQFLWNARPLRFDARMIEERQDPWLPAEIEHLARLTNGLRTDSATCIARM